MIILNPITVTTIHSKLHEKNRENNPAQEMDTTSGIVFFLILGIIIVWMIRQSRK